MLILRKIFRKVSKNLFHQNRSNFFFSLTFFAKKKVSQIKLKILEWGGGEGEGGMVGGICISLFRTGSGIV